jgi:hypothetical protein
MARRHGTSSTGVACRASPATVPRSMSRHTIAPWTAASRVAASGEPSGDTRVRTFPRAEFIEGVSRPGWGA